MHKSSVVTLAVALSNDREVLCFGGSQSSLTHLQFVQNAAARLLTGGKKRGEIHLLLASLHRLPKHFRVPFLNSLIRLRVMIMMEKKTQKESPQDLLMTI